MVSLAEPDQRQFRHPFKASNAAELRCDRMPFSFQTTANTIAGIQALFGNGLPRHHARFAVTALSVADLNAESKTSSQTVKAPLRGILGLEFCLYRSDIVDKSGQFGLRKTRASEQVMCPEAFMREADGRKILETW